MTELRHVMGLLTMTDEGGDGHGGGADPQPGLNQLEALVGRVRDTGLRVDLTVTGPPRPLRPASNSPPTAWSRRP